MERKKGWLVRLQVCVAMLLGIASAFASSESERLKHLERSFSLHASLAAPTQNGNWDTNFPSLEPPTETQIHNAARVLTQDYNANRLYLIYQKEIPLVDAERVFQIWRAACPSDVEIVPALMLNAGTNQHQLFSAAEIRRLGEFFRQEVNPKRLAVLGSIDARLNESSVKTLSPNFTAGLLRLGLQPGEKGPFSAGIVETRTALCSSQSNEQWQHDASGLEALRKWIDARNEQSLPITWGLVAVGCDDSKANHTSLGPNDPERNIPIISGRNAMAISEILQRGKTPSLAGFSVDLQALQVSSQAVSHDGSGYSFYELLKRGQVYVGYYARPFLEIVNAYGTMRSGKMPANER